MPVLVEDCPRCGAKQITFDVTQALLIGTEYNWQKWYEIFCVCRNCHLSTTFRVGQRQSKDPFFESIGTLLSFSNSLNGFVEVKDYVNLRDRVAHVPPEHVPSDVANAFKEGATCVTVQCWNAAGAMFRTCIDLATRPMLPSGEGEGLNRRIRRDLGLRLPWLFEQGLLPENLRELSTCIREDGNDGVHAGTLGKEDAMDLLDFTRVLLERLYTEPEVLRLAKERRDVRRQKGGATSG